MKQILLDFMASALEREGISAQHSSLFIGRPKYQMENDEEFIFKAKTPELIATVLVRKAAPLLVEFIEKAAQGRPIIYDVELREVRQLRDSEFNAVERVALAPRLVPWSNIWHGPPAHLIPWIVHGRIRIIEGCASVPVSSYFGKPGFDARREYSRGI